MKLIFALALAILIQPTSSRADSYAGVGATSCGQIAQDYRQNPKQIEIYMMTWAQGFMSGANTTFGLERGQYRDMGAMTTEAQEESLRNYCDEHPMAEFMKAVVDLYSKLPLKKYPSW
jgi:coproporphyrinogen III oxidase-like Fe-S oxidoreductase